MTVSSDTKRANLRDVARKSGVSVATVSRVLNAPEKVAAITRNRVLEAMDDLRFVPSAAARAINSGRTRIVGALIPTLDNAIFARVLEHLEASLGQRGLSLVVSTTGGDHAVETQKAQALLDIGGEGLILVGVSHAPELDRLIERYQTPAIVTSFFDPSYHLPTIGYDNRQAAAIALQHLIDLGHRRIAVLHGPRHISDRTRARLAGLEPLAAGLDLFYQEDDISVPGGCRAMATVLDRGQSVTAVLCLSDVLATGALYELHRRSIRVPDQISVMGFENMPGSAVTSPRLSTVRLSVGDMGETAGHLMAEWLENGIRPASSQLPAGLIVRESTAAPPPQGS